jgi:ribosomal protein S18 acetylase RimI-like enzyme
MAERETLRFRNAFKEEHKDLLKIAKTSKHTSAFGSIMFSSPEAYDRGWIRVIELDGKVVGFSCRRDKIRSPETVLYFITILPEHRRSGMGWSAIQDFMSQSPHKVLTLNCAMENVEGLAFYHKHGFTVTGITLGGEGVGFRREF